MSSVAEIFASFPTLCASPTEPARKRRVIGLTSNYEADIPVAVPVPEAPTTPRRPEADEMTQIDAVEAHNLFGTPNARVAPTPVPTPSHGLRSWHASSFQEAQQSAHAVTPKRLAYHALRFDLPVVEETPSASEVLSTPGRKAFSKEFFASAVVCEELANERQAKVDNAPQFYGRVAHCERDYDKSMVGEQRRVRSLTQMLADDTESKDTTATPMTPRSFGRKAFHSRWFAEVALTTDSPNPKDAPRTRYFSQGFEDGELVRTNNAVPASPLRPGFHRTQYEAAEEVAVVQDDTQVA